MKKQIQETIRKNLHDIEELRQKYAGKDAKEWSESDETAYQNLVEEYDANEKRLATEEKLEAAKTRLTVIDGAVAAPSGTPQDAKAAQDAKVRHIAAKLCLAPGQSVLDIGSGWGSLAIALARMGGARVTGVTLSREQQALATTRAQAAGLATVFATGPGSREQAALRELQKLEPGIAVLPPMPSLRLYLAVLRRARAVVAGDTGPLHFAAGLGVPVVGLFATGDSLLKSAPVYEARQVVRGSVCHCDGRQTHSPVCGDGQPCVLGIRTEAVFAALTAALAAE